MSEIPTAHLERRRRPSLVWLVPVVCMVMVSAFVYGHFRSLGPVIAIHFPDAEGVVPNKTLIKYLGVAVGKVTDVDVETGTGTVNVSARLDRSAEALAREGTVFVMVKPQVSFQGVAGLTTIFSGSTLDLRPGDGPPAKDFRGFSDNQSVARDEPGLILELTTPHNGSVTPGVGVFYRGMKVGEVHSVTMSPSGQQVVIRAKIESRYHQFVRDNTKFWDAGGMDAKIGLFGAKVKVDSMQALWNGGIAFATPEPPGKTVRSGTTFPLEAKIDPAWENWSPKL